MHAKQETGTLDTYRIHMLYHRVLLSSSEIVEIYVTTQVRQFLVGRVTDRWHHFGSASNHDALSSPVCIYVRMYVCQRSK